jgi:hypothetical protein
MHAAQIEIHLRRRAMKPRTQKASTLAPPAGHIIAVVCATEIVTVVVAVAAVGVMVAGVKAHEAPVGNPEQLKPTVPLNPPSAVSVMVSGALSPGAMVSVAVFADTLKSEFVSEKLAAAVELDVLAVTVYAPATPLAVAVTVAIPEALVTAVAAERVALAPVAGAE